MRLFKHIALLIAFLCVSCTQKGTMDKKFSEIDAMCDSDPKIAMSMLDSIDYGSLSTTDRHRYDLLSIKSRDKAYVRHTSDSLILDVIDYYQTHQKSGLYPEALYYGGRVYSDIGDLPTALIYFQKAIDKTPKDKKHLRFKRNVVDQTGRLLHSLRLDTAAIDYLHQSLAISAQLNDNAENTAFTHVLLSKAYLKIHDYKNARSHIEKTVKYSPHMSLEDKANMKTDLAEILASEGKLDSALVIIRPLSSIVDSLALSKCLALSSEIYLDAGILDTAYMYARQLTQLTEPSNKRTGYKVIFSEKLKNFVPKDTLVSLTTEYKQCIEEYLSSHEGENAIIQHTKYNYDIHERERIKAEKKLYIYILIASLAVIVSLILLATLLFRKFRTADTQANVVTAINLMKETQETPETYVESETNTNDESPDYETEKLADIKRRIISDIQNLYCKDSKVIVNPTILADPTYINLKDKVDSESTITNSEEKTVYKSLEELIESVSPGFSLRLRILTEDKITPSEKRMALLIKCGFSPLQVAVLFGREKNTISTHRRNLAFKITGQKKADKGLDMIIISL